MDSETAKVLWISVGVINLWSFLLVGLDKRWAETGQRRLSEVVLLAPGLFCGSLGLVLGMVFFRNRTQKPAFQLKALAIALINVSVIIGVFYPEIPQTVYEWIKGTLNNWLRQAPTLR